MTPAEIAVRRFPTVYRDGERNYCPGCGGLAWIRGRSSAECSACGYALDVEHPETRGAGVFTTSRRTRGR